MSSENSGGVTNRHITLPAGMTLDVLDKRLLAYAAVVGAGMLAATSSAEAGVIYNATAFSKNYPSDGSFLIDLNSDSTNDFWFGTRTGSSLGYLFTRSFFGDGQNGGQIRQPFVAPDASFFNQSNWIGPAGASSRWVKSDGLASGGWSYSVEFGTSNTWSGKRFANAGEGYLGVRIPTPGQQGSYNYGWIRFNITVGDSSSTVPIGVGVRGWAFEQTPDTPIHAGDEGGDVPEPGSLGLLAGGILGLAAWRRRKTSRD